MIDAHVTPVAILSTVFSIAVSFLSNPQTISLHNTRSVANLLTSFPRAVFTFVLLTHRFQLYKRSSQGRPTFALESCLEIIRWYSV